MLFSLLAVLFSISSFLFVLGGVSLRFCTTSSPPLATDTFWLLIRSPYTVWPAPHHRYTGRRLTLSLSLTRPAYLSPRIHPTYTPIHPHPISPRLASHPRLPSVGPADLRRALTYSLFFLFVPLPMHSCAARFTSSLTHPASGLGPSRNGLSTEPSHIIPTPTTVAPTPGLPSPAALHGSSHPGLPALRSRPCTTTALEQKVRHLTYE
ncbi:uncharacterized protein SCHCODRAFT_02059238 [Schizophyllum commune H4-8]|uniref:Expressed protein n=1 Tax=Schizophyllum commune (strain H4-8 / FGSC 9210) TaxID=578458 RepID=D8QDP0_SCHCM|nr:uncharacterized protein SCHCODRAFT_02059238 [Schizophyllum commune H4-8]KAI5888637.1 hypothetical protein SCHCODRAFT_02059238 [Schizophyllum commune H4-8]